MKKENLELISCLKVIAKHFKKAFANQPDDFEHSIQNCRAIEFIGLEKKTMSEISEELNLKPSSTTTQIDKMIDSGLAKREHDKDDRRKVYIMLTKKGQIIYEFFMKNYYNCSKEMLSFLSEKERETYIKLSKKITEGLSKK